MPTGGHRQMPRSWRSECGLSHCTAAQRRRRRRQLGSVRPAHLHHSAGGRSQRRFAHMPTVHTCRATYFLQQDVSVAADHCSWVSLQRERTGVADVADERAAIRRAGRALQVRRPHDVLYITALACSSVVQFSI